MTFSLRAQWMVVVLMITVLQLHAKQTEPAFPGTRILTSGDLSIEVDDPEAPVKNLYNKGLRFSPVAMVLRAQYKGREYLYAPRDGGSYGWVGGLPMEFDLGDVNCGIPPGYEQADVGQPFLKIGVGILRRDTEKPYKFNHDYPVVELAETDVHWEKDQAHFTQRLAGDADGYAYALDETLRLEGDRLILQYRLANTGTRTFTTEQYLHNFLCFSGRSVGPDYRVSFPYTMTVKGHLEPAVQVAEKTLTFAEPITDYIKPFIYPPAGYHGPNSLTVRQTELKQGLYMDASLRSHNVAIWATNEQLSPEMNLLIRLEPGEDITFQRTYRFILE